MTLPRSWSRAIAMTLGLALLAGSGTPARAADADPADTVATTNRQGASAEENPLVGALVPELADTDGGNPLNSGLAYGLFGLVTVALGAMRLSRGIFRASRVVTRTGGNGGKSETFEDRLAEKLRALEPSATVAAPAPIVPPPAAIAPTLPIPVAPLSPLPLPPVARPMPGPRTFGRRGA